MSCCHVPSVSAPSTNGTVTDGPEQRRTHVTRAVVVAPEQMVLVVRLARRQPLEYAVQVRDRTRLELNRGDAGGGTDDEDGRRPRPRAGARDRRRDLLGDIPRVALPFRGDLERLRRDHGRSIARRTRR